MLSLWLADAALVLGMMSLLWLLSVHKSDVSIVDPWWSFGFLVITLQGVLRTERTPAKLLLLGLVATWSLRLWAHLLWRSRGRPEDPRYAAFRQRFGPQRYWWLSYFQVFLLQGLLMLIISAPLVVATAAAPPDPIGPAQLLGAALVVVGFLFEAIADHQLTTFRGDPARRGQVLDRGLWRYSRHPNYFGEALLWWGYYVLALPQPYGWATIFAPALMSFLLLRVSGVTMLDAHLSRTKPGYAEYVRRTSAFFPRPPRA
jgi:steroid 5-alpha reductase family enzyme